MTDQTENPTEGPARPQPGRGSLSPGSLEWRISVATYARDFFNPLADRSEMAALIGKQHDPGVISPWSVREFLAYLPKAGFQVGDTWSIVQILNAMQRVGVLAPVGWDASLAGLPFVGQLYITHAGTPSPRSRQSSLWLAEVLGAELLINCFNLVTVLIGGGEGKRVGTGLVLDRNHVVTNRHVIEGLVGNGHVGHDRAIVNTCGSRSLCRLLGSGGVVGPFDEFAVLELRAGADERHEMGRVDRPPA